MVWRLNVLSHSARFEFSFYIKRNTPSVYFKPVNLRYMLYNLALKLGLLNYISVVHTYRPSCIQQLEK